MWFYVILFNGGEYQDRVSNCVLLSIYRYNPSNGVFTADIAGLYFFSVYFEIDDDANTALKISKNGSPQCYARGEGDPNGTLEESASCSAVVELRPRDEVSVIVESTDVPNPFETANKNGFTGFLVQAYA